MAPDRTLELTERRIIIIDLHSRSVKGASGIKSFFTLQPDQTSSLSLVCRGGGSPNSAVGLGRARSTYRQFLVSDQGLGLNNLDVVHVKQLHLMGERQTQTSEETQGDWLGLCVPLLEMREASCCAKQTQVITRLNISGPAAAEWAWLGSVWVDNVFRYASSFLSFCLGLGILGPATCFGQ